MILNMRLTAGSSDNPALRERRAELEKQISGPSGGSAVLVGLALVFGIIGVGLIAIAVKLRQRKLQVEGIIPSTLSMVERAKLRELLASFELPGNAAEEELTKAYRAKARTLHPDTGVGATDEFTQLTERYKEARDLIATRDS